MNKNQAIAVALSKQQVAAFHGALIAVALMLGVGAERAAAQRPVGVDVSHWQGTINWSSVRGSGISFAWANATEGTGYIDPLFTANQVSGKAAGVDMGAYHFARYDLNSGTSGATSEANYFWSVAKNYVVADGKTLMPALDVEAAPTGYSKATLSQWVDTWCQTVVSDAATVGLTVKPVVYASSSFASIWFDSTVTQWTPWIANWSSPNPQTGSPSPFSPWSDWTLWEYSATNSVSGISGNADVDVFNGTAATLSTLLVPEPGTVTLLMVPALLFAFRRMRK